MLIKEVFSQFLAEQKSKLAPKTTETMPQSLICLRIN